MIYIISLILLIIMIYMIVAYNRMVRLKNLCSEAWSTIDIQLKRRYNLIPNLVSTVKSYADFEQDVMENTVKLRNNAQHAGSINEQIDAELELTGQIKSLLAVVENYPELQANKTYQKLMETLIEIEDAIQYSRRYYNGTVRDLNIIIESFPSMIIASIFNISKREYFEIDLVTRKSVPGIKEANT